MTSHQAYRDATRLNTAPLNATPCHFRVRSPAFTPQLAATCCFASPLVSSQHNATASNEDRSSRRYSARRFSAPRAASLHFATQHNACLHWKWSSCSASQRRPTQLAATQRYATHHKDLQVTKPNFEVSVDTRLLHQALSKVKSGEEITYKTLSDIAGRDVRGNDTHLQSALQRSLTIDEAVFDNIRGVGYRRLTDDEIIAASGRDTDGLRRKARKAARKLTMVNDLASLPGEKRIEHNARLSLFAAITSMTKPAGVEAIRSGVKAAGGELPFAKTLAAFRKAQDAAA